MTDAAGDVRGKARVVRPNRAQLSWDLVDPEAWLPADHVARLVWSFVTTLELAALYDKVEACAGKSSFKRVVRLDEAVAAAQQRVAKLKSEVDADPAAGTKRREAARQRAAREIEARAVKAKAKLSEIAKERQERAKRSPKEIAG